MGIVEQYLLQLNTAKRQWRRAAIILTVLSLVVALSTVWNLRMTGITIANSASCGYEEHQHTEECIQEEVQICEKQEHIHSTGCYSLPNADVETSLDWDGMFAAYPYTGELRKDLVGIAKTQVGYTESQLNFEVNDSGVRQGYTRYGAWYGAPYNEWSAMFVSFCLNYARADSYQYPASSGASAMAELWKKYDKFAPVGEHIPQSGDLVFFNNNTVGIVAEIGNATFTVIRGDQQDAVVSSVLAVNDGSIIGWGLTGAKVAPPQETQPEETIPEETVSEETVPEETVPEDTIPAETVAEETVPEETVSEENVTEENPLDISNGPVFSISEGNAVMSEPQRSPFSLRFARTITDLLPYLEANGGEYFFTLLNYENTELPKDDQGNYIAQGNTGYKLTISFTSPKGFLPGTYQYQVPNGLMVDGGEGEFILKDGTNVGSWVVTDTGLITLVFNENMNSRSDITISATLGIHFPEQDDPIDFDGFISVKVEPPIPQKFPTELSKWGSPNADAGKLNWFVLIKGHADSQIPGSILTDQTTLPDWGKPHSYTESDIANGITISATAADGSWHTWTVTTDDPHLIWDANGWSYKIPQTAQCIYCGQLELGNDGWEYMVTYTSTPTPLNTPGTFSYENKVTVDGQTAWGWNEFTHGKMDATIVKNGSFVSDATDGGFLWEFQATIPGRPDGQRAEYSWFIMDEMKLFDDNGTAVRKVYNDVDQATVTAIYNGNLIQIPKVQKATAEDMFAWDVAWTSEGIASTRTLNLLCRCQCTPETCHWGGCEQYWVTYEDGKTGQNGFCQCWTETQNMTFTFVYKTVDLSMIQGYGTMGYQMNNLASLYHMLDGNTSIQADYDDATVTIPDLFDKQLTHDFNGYTAHYRITVNEAKLVLTNGSPLTIHDEMTDTLAYISGSLVITTVNENGHASALQQGVDFTVSYDGTGDKTDASGKKVHVLDIVILKPQPVMYILDYDTTLILPDHVTGGIKYTNSASVTLWGEKVTNPTVEKVYADINIAAKSFAVELFKTCAVTKKPLPGATFGLYNAQGGLVTTGITNTKGMLTFQSNVIEGIILQEHVLYYLQETRPPPAYRSDDTKHWFCFCSHTGNTCAECSKLQMEAQAVRMPFDQVGRLNVVNYPSDVVLPATGGVGTPLYILCGLPLIIGPLVYGFSLRRRYGRRSKQ